MFQAAPITVFNALAITAGATNNSEVAHFRDVDFVRVWAAITVQSFSGVRVTAQILGPNGAWFDMYDPFLARVEQNFTVDFTGTIQWGCRDIFTVGRMDELPLIGANIRFVQVVGGTSGTPGSITLRVHAYRKGCGSYQQR